MSSHYSGYKRILTIALVAVLSFGILGYAARTTQAAPLAQTVRTVHVNQIGYLPNLNKIASAVNSSTTPVAWQLKNSGGTVVASGNTTVYGNDAASRDNVHIIDFSSFTTAGTGYTLTVGTAVSNPFDISTSVYGVMKYDALAYFYHNRSGIAITLPYAGGSQWTRPAGHIQVAPNQGDRTVPCASDAGCSYSLDVSGGWYDAGDHGKYVVNGGISVWTMMNQYERAVHRGTSAAAFGDGRMNIPENANGVPDILDEARWEMDFMMKMQVPVGQTRAGMAHHKMHDANWTGIPLRPDQDNQARVLRPVSTAATLNLAATAAQCARIWRTIDSAFSSRCQTAADRAWAAAQANPNILASNSDGTGGGAYGDNTVSDDFYWAASELYITTGSATYLNFMTSSPHYRTVPGFGWADTAALGTISLAVVPNSLPAADLTTIRNNISTAANSYLNMINTQGYRVPFAGGTGGSYYWGSNSTVVNNGIVLALAYDFTGQAQYLNGVQEAMNYILGRNALDKSYVTGYGENPMVNPHHRFWAFQANSSFPHPPPGVMSGGPNSGLEDPYAAANLSGCAPAKCFADNFESYSTNEITINWNAPFAWLAAYLDEKAGATTGTPVPTTAVPTRVPTTIPTTAVPTRVGTTAVPTTAVPTRVPTTIPTTAVVPTNTQPPATGGLQTSIRSGGTDNNQQTAFTFAVKNTGTSAVSGISVRVYFTLDGANAASNYTLEKYYDQSGVATIAAPVQASGSVYYFQVNYGTASLAANAQWEFQSAMHLSSWGTNFDGGNDHFHTGFAVGALPAALTVTNYIPAYVNGTLAWGVQPGGNPTTVPTTAVPTRVPTTVVPTTAVPTRVPTTAVPTTAVPTRATTAAPTTAVPTRVVTTAVPTRIPTTGPTPIPGTHLDNPFVGANIYINPDYAASVTASAVRNPSLAAAMNSVANTPTFLWLDSIDAVNGTNGYPRSLVGHLDGAVAAGKNAIQIVVYDLPGRDCAALASNGELPLSQAGFDRYKTEYIDAIYNAISQAKYANLRIIAVIEPDSLPNLVTNTSDAECAQAQSQPYGYRPATQYTLNKLSALSNFYAYIDIGHHGWLGWSSNFGPAVTLIGDTIKGTTRGVNSIDGYISATANTVVVDELYHTANQSIGGQPARSAKWHDWNDYIDERTYDIAWRNAMVTAGFPSTIGMLIDTSRNGWGGSQRPAGPSTSTDLNTFVDQSRIDRRIHKGNWCNQSGAGIGARPVAAPAAGFDAFVWVKPPGESDGSSTLIPTGPDNPGGKGFDRMCDPTYTGNSLNGNSMSGALPGAPVSGRWFEAQFIELVTNAFPPFSGSNTPVPTTAVPTRAATTAVPTTAVPTRATTAAPTTAVPTRAATTAVPTTIPTTAVPTRVPTTVPTTAPTNPPTGGLQTSIRSGGTDNNQQTAFTFAVKNTGTSAVSGVSVRVYFTLDGANAASNYTLEKYYDQSGVATIAAPVQASGSVYYFQVNYGTASLAANASWEFQSAMHLASWGTNFDGGNDHFHTGFAVGALPAALTVTNYIPAYVNGTLAWGVQPGGTVPTTGPTIAPTTGSTTVPTRVPTTGPTTVPTTAVPTRVPTTGPTPLPGTHLDNPFVGANIYINPDYKSSVIASAGRNSSLASKMNAVANIPTFLWLDSIDAVNGTNGYPRSLIGHLDGAVAAGNNAIQIVVYDLPGRDCSALASNGELPLSDAGFTRYKTEYIDAIYNAISQAKYANLRIIAVIEPDSLPNLVTNLGVAACSQANSQPYGYKQATTYTLNKLSALSNFYAYIDIGHHGWLGWSSNFGPAVTLIGDVVKGTTKGVNSINGYISATANSVVVDELYHTANQSIGGQPARSSTWHSWNDYIDERTYDIGWRNAMIAAGFPSTLGMLIDTSRNGWGGPNRPTGPSTSTDLNTFVNQSRIDRRIHKGNWCNPSGAGIGARPVAEPAAGFDAFVWVKPPGESDGSSSLIPTGPDNPGGKGFDRMCDPTYTGNSLNGNSMTGALPNAPVSGRWFEAQFVELVTNAFPPLP